MSYVHIDPMNSSKVSTITTTKIVVNRAVIRIEVVDYSKPAKHSRGPKCDTITALVSVDTFVETIENFINDKATSVTIQGADNVFGRKEYITFEKVLAGKGSFEVTVSVGNDKCSGLISQDNLNSMLNYLK